MGPSHRVEFILHSGPRRAAAVLVIGIVLVRVFPGDPIGNLHQLPFRRALAVAGVLGLIASVTRDVIRLIPTHAKAAKISLDGPCPLRFV
jgi:hypothetical protein